MPICRRPDSLRLRGREVTLGDPWLRERPSPYECLLTWRDRTRSTSALPTNTPKPIRMKVTKALTSRPSPAASFAPRNCATPIKLTAPGTSSQNEGARVASDGGPEGRSSTHAATGVMADAPPNAPNGPDGSLAPSSSPIHAVISTRSNQPRLRDGPDRCT